jgi:hypothetical protein
MRWQKLPGFCRLLPQAGDGRQSRAIMKRRKYWRRCAVISRRAEISFHLRAELFERDVNASADVL